MVVGEVTTGALVVFGLVGVALVMFASATSFVTAVGYQTNLKFYGPAHTSPGTSCGLMARCSSCWRS